MNWLTILSAALQSLPYVVAGVNVIHQGASTETKTQIAQQVLSVATQGAVAELQTLSPGNVQFAQQVASIVNVAITGVQQIHDAATSPIIPAPQPTAPVAPTDLPAQPFPGKVG